MLGSVIRVVRTGIQRVNVVYCKKNEADDTVNSLASHEMKKLIDLLMMAHSDMIYLLTAIGLTPGGSSTVHFYLMTNLKHCFFLYMFISILYMFRAFKCSSSGDSIITIRYLVYVTLCR